MRKGNFPEWKETEIFPVINEVGLWAISQK
jgi:hypothetical protein